MTDSQVEAQAENNAEGVQKLTDTKAIIAYLVEKFPLCFIAEGEAKPLKIGLFQDLAEALKDDERVSKTQLRAGRFCCAFFAANSALRFSANLAFASANCCAA